MGDTPDIPERTSRFLDHLESRENEEETLLAAKEHLEDTIGDANAMLAGEVGEITGCDPEGVPERTGGREENSLNS